MQKTQTKETEDPFRTNFPFRLRKLRILFGSGLGAGCSFSCEQFVSNKTKQGTAGRTNTAAKNPVNARERDST